MIAFCPRLPCCYHTRTLFLILNAPPLLKQSTVISMTCASLIADATAIGDICGLTKASKAENWLPSAHFLLPLFAPDCDFVAQFVFKSIGVRTQLESMKTRKKLLVGDF